MDYGLLLDRHSTQFYAYLFENKFHSVHRGLLPSVFRIIDLGPSPIQFSIACAIVPVDIMLHPMVEGQSLGLYGMGKCVPLP